MVLTCISREAVASGSAAGSASVCAECLSSFGVDPLIAGPVAVIVGVLVRLGVDYARERVQARRAAAAASVAPVPARPPEYPDGEAP